MNIFLFRLLFHTFLLHTDEDEDWTNVDAINERVIDNNGWFFDIQIADVNADGRDDVLVTTWA